VDGYFSYVNMEFIKTCDCLKICLFIFPLHLMHKLPLDIGMF